MNSWGVLLTWFDCKTAASATIKASCHFLYIILFDFHCFSIGIISCKIEILLFLYSECDFAPRKGILGKFCWWNPVLDSLPRASDFK